MSQSGSDSVVSSLPDLLRQSEIEAFELVIDAAESLSSAQAGDGLATDERNRDPQWEAGYRSAMGDLAEYLRRKVELLRSI